VLATSHAATSTAFFARSKFYAPLDEPKKKGQKWLIEEPGIRIEIDDMLTEDDCDLIEYLREYGNPTRLVSGEIAYSFSLYAMSHAIGQARHRIIERIRRRQKTMVDVTFGGQPLIGSTQVLGPSLHETASGKYIVTMTALFARVYERSMECHYGPLLPDIFAIRHAPVRRLVRSMLSHDFHPTQTLGVFLVEVGVGATTGNRDTRRIQVKRAVDAVLDCRDYLLAVFNIEIGTLRDGRTPAIMAYRRDPDDRRIWVKTHPSNSVPRPEQLGTVAEQLGTVGEQLGTVKLEQ
jgi:hypothetical protein